MLHRSRAEHNNCAYLPLLNNVFTASTLQSVVHSGTKLVSAVSTWKPQHAPVFNEVLPLSSDHLPVRQRGADNFVEDLKHFYSCGSATAVSCKTDVKRSTSFTHPIHGHGSTVTSVWICMAQVISECLRLGHVRCLTDATQRLLFSGTSPDEIYAAVLVEFARRHHDPAEFAAQYKDHIKVRFSRCLLHSAIRAMCPTLTSLLELPGMMCQRHDATVAASLSKNVV